MVVMLWKSHSDQQSSNLVHQVQSHLHLPSASDWWCFQLQHVVCTCLTALKPLLCDWLINYLCQINAPHKVASEYIVLSIQNTMQYICIYIYNPSVYCLFIYLFIYLLLKSEWSKTNIVRIPKVVCVNIGGWTDSCLNRQMKKKKHSYVWI